MSHPFPSDNGFDRDVGKTAETSSGQLTSEAAAATLNRPGTAAPYSCAPVDPPEGVTRPDAPAPRVAPSGLSCDPCVMNQHCDGLNRFCECDCQCECEDELELEEFVPHENDETLEAMRREGAHDFLNELYREVYRGWDA